MSSRPNYSGIRATVMGLGNFGGGVAAARFLAEHGARVSVTDLRDESQLTDSLHALQDFPIERVVTGQHPEELFRECQLLIVNPAVPPRNPLVELARREGAEISTEINLFLQHQQGRLLAVSGSNGKSTTAALTATLLQHSFPEVNTFLGGNIGGSLLQELHRIQSDDFVVLELSSFQLQRIDADSFHPQAAVLTGFSPNHLDWHGSLADYRTAKQKLFRSAGRESCGIVPAGSEADFSSEQNWRIRGRKHVFGLQDSGEDGAFIQAGMLLLRTAQGRREDTCRLQIPRSLPGNHNASNIAAACCTAWLCEADPAGFEDALRGFSPLPHRLQKTASCQGIQFWNDSKATTTTAAVAALELFSGRAILIAGGASKGVDPEPLAAAIRTHAKSAVLIGETAETLYRLLTNASGEQTPGFQIASDFESGFRIAVASATSGDIVLLSPGHASYDWFRDYRHRGEVFCELVSGWIESR